MATVHKYNVKQLVTEEKKEETQRGNKPTAGFAQSRRYAATKTSVETPSCTSRQNI